MKELLKEYYESAGVDEKLGFRYGLILAFELCAEYAKQFIDENGYYIKYQTALNMLTYLMSEADSIVHIAKEVDND